MNEVLFRMLLSLLYGNAMMEFSYVYVFGEMVVVLS